MAANKFEMASQALVLVGGNPITSFDGAGSEEVTASALYEPTVREVLGMYSWRFATRKIQLTRLEAVPLDEYDATYQLPSGSLVVRAVRVLDKSIEFDRYEDKILCNAGVGDKVVAEITFRASESYWPAYFEATIRNKLASLFAVPIAEDTQKASLYEGKFIRSYAAAKTLDAQGRTPRKLAGIGGLRRYHGGRP